MKISELVQELTRVMKGLPRIQIVSPTDSWILEKMGQELARNIPCVRHFKWKPDLEEKWDVVYFINYFLFQPVPNARLVGGYFTHQENDRFVDIARQMNFAVSMSEKYAAVLKPVCTRTVVVPPGVDLKAYTPKIRLAVSGRFYPSGRKGEDLVEIIRALPYVEVLTSEGRLSPEQMPEFYNSADFVFIPSKLEGGPMSLLEGLACGKEIIAPDVGMVPEFQAGVHRYDRDDPETLRRLLEGLHRKRLEIRKSVENLSWEKFAQRHLELFISLARDGS